MAEVETRRCTDCDGEMGRIKVLDKGHLNFAGPLEYAAIDAKPSIWTGIPIAGSLKSFMCSQCGLIKSYGVPKS